MIMSSSPAVPPHHHHQYNEEGEMYGNDAKRHRIWEGAADPDHHHHRHQQQHHEPLSSDHRSSRYDGDYHHDLSSSSRRTPATLSSSLLSTPTSFPFLVEFEVASNHIGLLIGKKGWTLNQIKEETGAMIFAPGSSPADEPDKKR
jgi:hypothetical protein